MLISAIYGSTVYARDVNMTQHRRNPDGTTRPDNHSLLYGYRESVAGGPRSYIGIRDAHINRVTGGALISGLLSRFDLMGSITDAVDYAHVVDHHQNFRNLDVHLFADIPLSAFGDLNDVLECGSVEHPCIPYQQLVERMVFTPACGTDPPAYLPSILERAQSVCQNDTRMMRLDTTSYTYECAGGVRLRQIVYSASEVPTSGACAMPNDMLFDPPTAPEDPVATPDGILP
jgi:hypothetical protein